MEKLKALWLWYLGRKLWQRIAIGFVAVVFVSNAIGGSPQTQTNSSSDSVETTQASSEMPKVDAFSDGILEKIIQDFYEANKTETWWSRIEVIEEGSLSNKVKKMVYIKTDYELSNVDDVENGTLLCNALIRFHPRSGLSVRVDGRITEGLINLDGSIDTKERDDQITYWGESADTGEAPDWCVGRALFDPVIAGLKSRGWKEQYGYGDLTPQEKEKMFEGRAGQTGSVFILNP